MKSNYDLLREEINKRLPDRLKLEFGCEVNTVAFKPMTFLYSDKYDHIDGEAYYFIRPNERFWVMSREEFEQQKYVEILGKPLTITDILRVLEKNGRWYAIDMVGNVVRESYGVGLGSAGVKFDLSFPLSDPKNNEACGKVLEILSV